MGHLCNYSDVAASAKTNSTHRMYEVCESGLCKKKQLVPSDGVTDSGDIDADGKEGGADGYGGDLKMKTKMTTRMNYGAPV